MRLSQNCNTSLSVLIDGMVSYNIVYWYRDLALQTLVERTHLPAITRHCDSLFTWRFLSHRRLPCSDIIFIATDSSWYYWITVCIQQLQHIYLLVAKNVDNSKILLLCINSRLIFKPWRVYIFVCNLVGSKKPFKSYTTLWEPRLCIYTSTKVSTTSQMKMRIKFKLSHTIWRVSSTKTST